MKTLLDSPCSAPRLLPAARVGGPARWLTPPGPARRAGSCPSAASAAPRPDGAPDRAPLSGLLANWRFETPGYFSPLNDV